MQYAVSAGEQGETWSDCQFFIDVVEELAVLFDSGHKIARVRIIDRFGGQYFETVELDDSFVFIILLAYKQERNREVEMANKEAAKSTLPEEEPAIQEGSEVLVESNKIPATIVHYRPNEWPYIKGCCRVKYEDGTEESVMITSLILSEQKAEQTMEA